MSNSSGSVEKLDDTDPRVVCVFPHYLDESFTTLTYSFRYRLRYTASVYPWANSSTWGSSGAYQNTLHMTQDAGSYATVIFKGMAFYSRPVSGSLRTSVPTLSL